MADNSSIAFEIYTTIMGKQNNLIKNNMIKEEDIIDITENDFIYKLQQTVNGLTADISDANIVAAVYTNILKKVDKADSFNDVFSKEDMEISSDIVRESINDARNSVVTTRQEVKNPIEEAVVAGIATEVLLQGLNEAVDYDSQLAYYNSLSEDEQKALSYAVYRETFGEDGASLMADYDAKTEILDSDSDFSGVSETVKEDAKRTMDLYDPLTYMAEELGFSIDSINGRANRTILLNSIDRYIENAVSNKRTEANYIEQLKSEITKILGLSDEEVKALFERIDTKLKEDPDFSQNMTKLNERLDRNTKLIGDNIEEIRRKLTEYSTDGHIPTDPEIYALCLTAFDENGNLKYAVVCANIKSNENYDKNYSVKDMLDFASKDVYANENGIQNINNSGIMYTQPSECVANPMSEVSMSLDEVGVKSASNTESYEMVEPTTQTEPISHVDNRTGADDISMDDLMGGFEGGLMSFAGKKISFGPVTRQAPVTDQEYGPAYRANAEEMVVDSKGLYKAQTDIKKINEYDGTGTGEGSDSSTAGIAVVQDNDTLEVDTINTHQPMTNSFINTARREDTEKDGKDLKGGKEGEGLEDLPPENDLPDNDAPNNSAKNANFMNLTRKMRTTTSDMKEIGDITMTIVRDGDKQQGESELGDESDTIQPEEIE